jgi:hypothetical protein
MIRSSSSVGFPGPRERGPKVRDWPLSRGTISPNEETGFSLNDEARFPLPGDWRTDFAPATWCRYATPSPGVVGPQRYSVFSARFTIDVTPEWRGRVRLAAFQGGVAVTDMPRAMPEGAFPKHGAAS